MESLANTFIVPARQTQSIQEIIFNNVPVSQVAVPKKTNSVFTDSYAEIQFWYQQFDLRQTRIHRGGHLIVHFDAADNCC